MINRHYIFYFLCSLFITQSSYSNIIHTRVPSESAGIEGLRVRINLPDQERYGLEGAPIVVYMAGGFHGDGLSERETGLSDHGFVEIRFNFPGSGFGDDISGGGPYDHRGPMSLIAARDMIRFAMNLTVDSSGQTLDDLTHPITTLPNNVGLIGWSNGGNTNICVAGLYGQDLPGLAWIINWESPVGDGMPQAEAGAKSEGKLRPYNKETNDAYNTQTGEWDLTSLSYDPQIQIPILDNTSQHVKGGFYFDFNRDDIVDLGEDFILYPLIFEFEGALKSFYSERVRNEADIQNLIPQIPPEHMSTVEETRTFWHWRNGAYWIDSTIVKNPDVMFMVVANDTDHVQRSPDHPHVLIQYNRFVNAGCRFVRLNPDQIYIKEMNGIIPAGTVDNDAFMTINSLNIQNCVEPGKATDTFGNIIVAAAGACELADRTQYNNIEINLSAPVTAIQEKSQNNRRYKLLSNYPNPFNSQTTLNIYLSETTEASLIIYNSVGQEITVLTNNFMLAGHHIVHWNGKNQNNIPVQSGIYIAKLKTDKQIEIRKMMLIQ